MRVFAIKANGYYAGGMAVVAAIDATEAQVLACNSGSRSTYWNVRYDKPESVDVLPVAYEGNAGVLSLYEMGE